MGCLSEYELNNECGKRYSTGPLKANIMILGDGRANQQAPLAIMQTLWLREHNRIAASLGRMNPRWSDEKIFQVSFYALPFKNIVSWDIESV